MLIAALRGALEELPSAAWLVDAEGTCRYLNRSAAALLDVDPAEVVNRPWSAPALPDTLRCTASPWRGPDGSVLGRVVIAKDQELTRTQRLAGVGALAGAVAHEVNNPLTILLDGLFELTEGWQAEGSAERTALGDPAYDAARRALEGGRRVADVLSDLSLIADDAQREPRATVDLRRLLEKCVDDCGGLTIRADVRRLPRIAGRHVALRRLFARLCAHASREVAGSAARDARVQLSAEALREGVVVTLRYPASSPERANPFALGESGVGVDLALARYVVDVHRGELAVRREGDTEIVSATLPIGLPTGVYSRDEIMAGPSTAVEHPHVVIIDDEPLVARALSRLLRRTYRVTTVGPHEAIDVLQSTHPDLIITDLMMPVLTGMDLVDWLRDHRPELIPSVVLMTGGAFTPRGQALVSRDEFPLLKKPFDNDQIARTLQRVLYKAQNKRESRRA